MAKLPQQLQAIQAASILAQPVLRCDFSFFFGGKRSNGHFQLPMVLKMKK